MGEDIKYFIDNGDFEMLMNWFNAADPVEVLTNPFVLIPLVAIIGMVIYPTTSAIGQKLLLYVPAAGFLFVTGVVLSNDVISNTGPFLMALVSFFMIVGWLIWTQLLSR